MLALMWGRMCACVAVAVLPLWAQDAGTRAPTPAGPKTAAPPVSGNIQGVPVDFGRYHALLIGIDTYEEGGSHLRNLQAAVNDIEELAGILRNNFGFHTVVLTNADATKARILEKIRAFQAEPSVKGASVLVWYAGHGEKGDADAPDGYWLPYGVDTEDNRTWLSFNQVHLEVSRVASHAHHVLLVSDSCFSGGLSDVIGSSVVDTAAPKLDELRANPSFRVITSGDIEVVQDVYKHGHSPFATSFRHSLKAVADDPDRPWRTAAEIAAEVGPKVRAEADGQTPTTSEEPEGSPGEFLFAYAPHVLSPEELEALTSSGLRDMAERLEHALPDGRPLYRLARSRDEADMVLVRGSVSGVRHVSPFLIDRDEVTVRRFRKFLEDYGASVDLPYLNHPNYGAPEQPIVGVSFELARAFAKWAGKDLPTETEWQDAAGYEPERPDARRTYPWVPRDAGDEPPEELPPWTPFPPPTADGTNDVSPWGARRMATGVREWCRPADPRGGWRTAICGGTQVQASLRDRSDLVPEETLRCSYRTYSNMVAVPYRNVGFRCVRRLR